MSVTHPCQPAKLTSVLESPAGRKWTEAIEKEGSFTWNVTVARKPLVASITARDLDEFVKFDTSVVWDQFPSHTDVLTLHGMSDQTVPPYVSYWNSAHRCLSYFSSYDALIYAKALSNRMPGTHALHMMEGADHNFTGRQDEVVDVILGWWERRVKGQLQTGADISLAYGVASKGKL